MPHYGHMARFSGEGSRVRDEHPMIGIHRGRRRNIPGRKCQGVGEEPGREKMKG